MRILPLLIGAAIACALQAPAQSIDCHFECAGGVPFKLVWQSQADRSYDLFYSPDLSGWTHVAGYPQPGNGASMEHPFAAGTQGFYRITSEAPVLDGFVLIPAGSFLMGDQSDPPVGFSTELPVHSVYVSAFYMGKYEVTKALWDEVAEWAAGNGYDINAAGASGKAPNHPAYYVTWYECVKWCNARSEKENLTPCYSVSGATYKTGDSDTVACNWSANGYRLPTEAEWEKAARGGAGGLNFPWGETISHSQANYKSNPSYSYDVSPTEGYHPDWDEGGLPYTSPVGSFGGNGYGLYDMVGNVEEWCWDREWRTYTSSPETDPRSPASGRIAMKRGGGWTGYGAGYCRVAYRGGEALGNYYNRLGFRPARSSVP